MKIKSNLRIIIGVSLLLLVVVIIWQLLLSLKSHQLITNAKYARKAGEPLPVSTVVAQSGSLDSIVSAECVVKESAHVVLSADVSGSVISVYSKVGDAVSKGQVLVEFDDTALKADLDNTRQAEKVLITLKKELKPFISDMRKLREKGVVPVMDLLDAIERLRRAEVDLIRVRREKLHAIEGIEGTRIFSPITGVITELEVEVGTVLQSYENVITVSRLDPIWLECQFATDMLSAINDFDKAAARISAYPGDVYTVEIEKILPVTDEETHAIVAQFKLSNKERSLFPGMQAIVSLNKLIEGVKIPSISLINHDGASANVFVVDDNNEVHFLQIGIGRYAEGYVEVTNGLSSGQRVVVVGQGSLQDGDTVIDEIVENTGEGANKTLFPVKRH